MTKNIEQMKNQVQISDEKRIKGSKCRIYATKNSENNENRIFADSDLRRQFASNEEGISWLKNQTFKSNPIFDMQEDRFIATTENWYYVVFFVGK